MKQSLLLPGNIKKSLSQNIDWSPRFSMNLYSVYIYNLHIFSVLIKQAKNIWQAEIDAAAELIDFLRFNCQFSRVSHCPNIFWQLLLVFYYFDQSFFKLMHYW